MFCRSTSSCRKRQQGRQKEEKEGEKRKEKEGQRE